MSTRDAQQQRRERPILFSGPMVRAILDGRKTQTRRVAKGFLPWDECPYGLPGDRLWVRETYRSAIHGAGRKIVYRADQDGSTDGFVWRPSIFMPRALCRLVLDVAAVGVERLQDISLHDCYAEGCERPNPLRLGSVVCETDNARGWYTQLWDSLNAKRGFGWATNPWVWVVEFKRAEAIRRAA